MAEIDKIYDCIKCTADKCFKIVFIMTKKILIDVDIMKGLQVENSRENGWQTRHIVDDDCMFSLSDGFKSGTVCCAALEGSRFSL